MAKGLTRALVQDTSALGSPAICERRTRGFAARGKIWERALRSRNLERILDMELAIEARGREVGRAEGLIEMGLKAHFGADIIMESLGTAPK